MKYINTTKSIAIIIYKSPVEIYIISTMFLTRINPYIRFTQLNFNNPYNQQTTPRIASLLEELHQVRMITVHVLKHVALQYSASPFIHNQSNIVILPFTQHHTFLITLPQLLHYPNFSRRHKATTRASCTLRTYHIIVLPANLIMHIIV